MPDELEKFLKERLRKEGNNPLPKTISVEEAAAMINGGDRETPIEKALRLAKEKEATSQKEANTSTPDYTGDDIAKLLNDGKPSFKSPIKLPRVNDFFKSAHATSEAPTILTPESQSEYLLNNPRIAQEDKGFRTVEASKVIPTVGESITIEENKTNEWENVAQEASRSLARGFYDTVPAILESIAVSGKKIDDRLPKLLRSYSGKNTEELVTYRLAKKLRSDGEELFPINKDLQNNFLVQTAQGLGQVGAMLLSRSPISAGTMGAAQLGSGEFRESLQYYKDIEGLSKEDFIARHSNDPEDGNLLSAQYDKIKSEGVKPDERAFENWLYGAAIGTTEAIPILKFLKKVDNASGGIVKKTLLRKAVDVGKQGVEELLQESISQLATNYSAKETYDVTRDLLKDVKRSGEVGGVVGLITGALLGMNSHRLNSTADPNERAILTANQKQIENLATDQEQNALNETRFNPSKPLTENAEPKAIPALTESTIERDNKVREFQSKFPDKIADLLEGLPENVVRTFERVETNTPTNPVSINEASNWLYNRYKQLMSMKKADTRLLTTEQIDSTMDKLAEDIAILENHKQKYYGDGDIEIEPSKGRIEQNILEQDIASLEADFNNPEVSQDIKDIIAGEIDLKEQQIEKLRDVDLDNESNQRFKSDVIQAFDDDITALEQTINNPQLSEIAKEAIQSKINEKVRLKGDFFKTDAAVASSASSNSNQVDANPLERENPNSETAIVEANTNNQYEASTAQPEISESHKEHLSTQATKRHLIDERIKPASLDEPVKSSKKINQIIKDVSDGLNSTLIYGNSGGRNTLGSYNPSSTLIKIKNAGDIDTAAHEIGHLIDDRYNLLGNVPDSQRKTIEGQLKWYHERGGSNPPKSLSKEAKNEYLQREGFGEFIRAYVANPNEAFNRSKELFQYFESTVDEKTKAELRKFSDDYISFSNTSAGEQVLANVESLEDRKPGVKEWLKSFSGSKDGFHVSFLDKLNAQAVNSLAIANKGFDYILNSKGITDVLPEKNFETLARLFAGVNGKVNRIFESGLINAKNEYLKSSDGQAMTINWLFDQLDSSSDKTLKAEMDEVIKLLVAERTIEYAGKFGKTNSITGIGGGINNDLEVAERFIKDFDVLKNEYPEKYERLRVSADRYREYADAGLRYAVEKGRISEAIYEEIKTNNKYYVSLARVNEIAPTEEPLAFINKYAAGGLASVKEVIQKAKGGTGTIQNPYLSLLKNTADLIRESDRNEVIRSFIEPLRVVRAMGDGNPVNFSELARKVSPGEKNAKTIYVDGKKESWQFQDDIYDALSGMSNIAPNLMVKMLSGPGSVLRWSVTHFPVFAAKNFVRDTVSRIILSRSGSGLKEIANGLTNKELFDLYGGSQAGYFLADKKAYANQLKASMQELVSSGKGIVLDPRLITKGWEGYKKFLEKGENINRVAEFRTAFEKAKKGGLDDYNAGLVAAFEARDTMDFAVAGHFVKTVNQIIPFTNAAVQGLRRSAVAIKENPAGFAGKIALYTVLPQLFCRALIFAMGDQDEYEQLPSYHRDLFWTFRTPFTSDKWICIPKPFDLGLPSSFIDRLISSIIGNKDAFNDFEDSLYHTLLPIDEGSIMGPFKPIVEIMINKDTFRDMPIIPEWESKRLLKNREGANRASTISKALSDAMGAAGGEFDPRYIDHFIKSQFSYFGDFTLSSSDFLTGNKDSKNKLSTSKLGFVKEPPVANAQAVRDVYELAYKLGFEKSAAIKELSGMIKQYYSIEREEKRREFANEIYQKALALKRIYEQQRSDR